MMLKKLHKQFLLEANEDSSALALNFFLCCDEWAPQKLLCSKLHLYAFIKKEEEIGSITLFIFLTTWKRVVEKTWDWKLRFTYFISFHSGFGDVMAVQGTAGIIWLPQSPFLVVTNDE